jgi:hypothetical protein
MIKEIRKWKQEYPHSCLQRTYFELIETAYKMGDKAVHSNMTVSVKQHIDQYKGVECDPRDMFDLLYNRWHPVRNIIELNEDIIKTHEQSTR